MCGSTWDIMCKPVEEYKGFWLIGSVEKLDIKYFYLSNRVEITDSQQFAEGIYQLIATIQWCIIMRQYE